MRRDASADVHRQIDACVRELRGEMIDFTSELVAVASENPPGARYADCVRVIASRLRALGLPCERVPYRPQRGARDESGAAVVLSSLGSAKRTLYFSGHYDVVPMMTRDQCTPVLRGKALFGRGTADMKGGLASMLYAGQWRCSACECRSIGVSAWCSCPTRKPEGGEARGSAQRPRC